MEALRRVTSYPLLPKDAHTKLRVESEDPVLVELVGYSDSDKAGDLASRKSQRIVFVDADGCPMASFSRK